MEFEWDENKRRYNLAKHNVYFEDAVTVFLDPDELTLPAKTVNGEERFRTIGRLVRPLSCWWCTRGGRLMARR